ncbi:hypothetical protein Voc01_032280 [Virgisporangium ochraceum]|uniref:Diguanylate cyclase with PAS/PAC sensor n=1 Tax=Virgisporangium ochraceum TaxID=65505 RepID=A0A8J3ZRB9_9ACTN|nr:hypothetical protein Voc01_032280 [Virgisporangium ochraceum]
MLLGLALATVPFFLAGLGSNRSSWLIQTGLDTAIVAFSLRLMPLGREPAGRRFWRSLALAGALCATGDGYQTVLVLHDPQHVNASLVQTAFVVVAMGVMVVTMLRHPLGTVGRQRLRVLLDAATVLVAVGVFLWYFLLAGRLHSDRMTDRYVAAATSIIMLITVFGLLKLILSGTAPFTRVAGLAGGIGVSGSALATSIGPVLTGGSNPRLMFVIQLLPCILTVASLRMQELHMRRRDGRPESRRRRYSRLPYLAVVATQILMVVALFAAEPGARVWGVAIGVLIITGLVLSRQLTAFQDNDRLLTSLDQSMLELHSQKEWFRSVVQHASDVTLVVDDRGAVSYASPSVAKVLGTTPEDAVGMLVHERVHRDDLPVIGELGERLAAEPGSDASARVRLRHIDGTYRWLDIVGVDLRDNASVRGFLYSARDVTEAHELQEELRHRATHDALTGLANRALLGERLRAAAGTEEVSVLIIDLDGFKQVNDIYGHHVGDELLIAVARRLTACTVSTSPGGTVARLGGDEFAVLLPEGSAAQALRLAATVRDNIGDPVEVAGERLLVGASVGISTGPADDMERLLRDADAAMYAAKNDRKAAASA